MTTRPPAPVSERVYRGPRVAILTGGGDRPYALGLASALMAERIPCDFIGSDGVDSPELHDSSTLTFLNLRGDQDARAGALQKFVRVLAYYARLFAFCLTSRARVFHILWHNRFVLLDRTLVMGFYKLLGKRIVFTAHNVNAGKRDGCDTWLNRLSLRSEYRLADRIFVHTEQMKRELGTEFSVPDEKVVVIPFGINNTLPKTALSREEARRRLAIGPEDKTVLFFGNVAPYKGLEFLVEAMIPMIAADRSFRLVIAGRTKGSESYWEGIRDTIARAGIGDNVTEHIRFVPDEEVEVFFKASDLLVLPYRHIFQSGVLFLGYSFGLPIVASDVGSLREEIEDGKTGYICRPEDSADLGRAIRHYFDSELFAHLEDRRSEIAAIANERYSWTKVGRITASVYESVVGKPGTP